MWIDQTRVFSLVRKSDQKPLTLKYTLLTILLLPCSLVPMVKDRRMTRPLAFSRQRNNQLFVLLSKRTLPF